MCGYKNSRSIVYLGLSLSYGRMHVITKDHVVFKMQCFCSLNHNMYPRSKVQSNKG